MTAAIQVPLLIVALRLEHDTGTNSSCHQVMPPGNDQEQLS